MRTLESQIGFFVVEAEDDFPADGAGFIAPAESRGKDHVAGENGALLGVSDDEGVPGVSGKYGMGSECRQNEEKKYDMKENGFRASRFPATLFVWDFSLKYGHVIRPPGLFDRLHDT